MKILPIALILTAFNIHAKPQDPEKIFEYACHSKSCDVKTIGNYKINWIKSFVRLESLNYCNNNTTAIGVKSVIADYLDFDSKNDELNYSVRVNDLSVYIKRSEEKEKKESAFPELHEIHLPVNNKLQEFLIDEALINS
jgi:hypothetical protein